MEALCILLCQKFPHPRREVNAGTGRPVYTSRWKCILSEYNSVRARLLNSQALLEGTNLVLYTVNETTLLHWYKNSVRRDEIKLLMQGLSLPQHQLCAGHNLPPPQQLPSSLPPPVNPHISAEPEDTTGQAKVRKPKSISAPTPSSAGPSSLSVQGLPDCL